MLTARAWLPLGIRSLTRVCLLLSIASLAAACGQNYRTIDIHEYRLTVVNDAAAEFGAEFRALCGDFNRYAGMEVLRYVADPAQANSAIVITEGLKERDQKVGWGQWIAETQAENPFGKLPGEQLERKVRYSMRVEFDAAYFRERMGAETEEDRYEKQKLFFHEVGHGLEMDHVPDVDDVMFENVEGDKDFNAFFRKVRAYMAAG